MAVVPSTLAAYEDENWYPGRQRTSKSTVLPWTTSRLSEMENLYPVSDGHLTS